MPSVPLPVLCALQETFGSIDREAESLAIEALSLFRAEVHTVVTFSHDFRLPPPPMDASRWSRSASSGCARPLHHAREIMGAVHV